MSKLTQYRLMASLSSKPGFLEKISSSERSVNLRVDQKGLARLLTKLLTVYIVANTLDSQLTERISKLSMDHRDKFPINNLGDHNGVYDQIYPDPRDLSSRRD